MLDRTRLGSPQLLCGRVSSPHAAKTGCSLARPSRLRRFQYSLQTRRTQMTRTIEELEARLQEAEELLNAIRRGEVDALVHRR